MQCKKRQKKELLIWLGILAAIVLLGRLLSAPKEIRIPQEEPQIIPETHAETIPRKPGKYKAGDQIPEADIPGVIEQLIQCESSGASVTVMDKGSYSYGILQYKSSTWNGWSEEFGFEGSPMRPGDAKEMTRRALRAGYLYHWTCAKILGLL